MPQAFTTGETPSRSYADPELTQRDDGRARTSGRAAGVSRSSARSEADHETETALYLSRGRCAARGCGECPRRRIARARCRRRTDGRRERERRRASGDDAGRWEHRRRVGPSRWRPDPPLDRPAGDVHDSGGRLRRQRERALRRRRDVDADQPAHDVPAQANAAAPTRRAIAERTLAVPDPVRLAARSVEIPRTCVRPVVPPPARGARRRSARTRREDARRARHAGRERRRTLGIHALRRGGEDAVRARPRHGGAQRALHRPRRSPHPQHLGRAPAALGGRPNHRRAGARPQAREHRHPDLCRVDRRRGGCPEYARVEVGAASGGRSAGNRRRRRTAAPTSALPNEAFGTHRPLIVATTSTRACALLSTVPSQPQRAERIRIFLDRLVERYLLSQKSLISMANQRRRHQDAEVTVETEKCLHKHRFIPEEWPFVTEYPEFWRIRNIVWEGHVVNLNHDPQVQTWKHL